MSSEIERKFLLKDKSIFKNVIERYDIEQAYISSTINQETRVRLIKKEDEEQKAFITIKSKKTEESIERKEFEYEIPLEDAKDIVKMGESYIKKDRYVVPYENNSELKWEIDVFKDANKGLTIVEIEIPSEDYNLKLPEWLGEEVTNNSHYNSNRKLSLNNLKDCSMSSKQSKKTRPRNR